MSGPTTSDPAIAGPLDRATAEALLARADVLLAASEFDAARAHYARLIGFPDPALTGAALPGAGSARAGRSALRARRRGRFPLGLGAGYPPAGESLRLRGVAPGRGRPCS